MQAYTLFELNEYIKRVIALNFQEPIWITCEISQSKCVRGNWYLDLVEMDEKGDIIAQSQAALWSRNYLFIKSKLGVLIDSILEPSTKIKIKVSVDFSERYGLKLLIEDIDASFTIGQIELSRQIVLEKLKHEGILDKNKLLRLPRVIQRLAVLSSPDAAGYKDFAEHLRLNSYGFAFKIDLFQVALQGQNTEPDITKNLEELSSKPSQYDCVIIIRGGGSKIDLAAFDHYRIAWHIAHCALPVITGIGHEIDVSVADMVANTSLKTPTAVADFIIERNLHFELELLSVYNEIIERCKNKLKEKYLQLENISSLIEMAPRLKLNHIKFQLEHIGHQVSNTISKKIASTRSELSFIEQQLNMARPDNLLRRGFTIIRKNNQIIERGKQLKKQENVEIQFFDTRHSASIV